MNILAIEVIELVSLIENHDKQGRFVKGSIPWNKGTKGLVKSNKGTFKKRHRFPSNIEKRRIEKIKHIFTIKPFLEINENMTYLLGLLMGDGYVTHNSYTNAKIVALQNTELILVENFANCLKRIGLNPRACVATPSKKSFNKKISYRVEANSKVFYEWYKSLRFNQLGKQFDTQEKVIAFIRGFYEAEGTLYSTKGHKRLIFTNTNAELINFVKNLLEKIDLHFHLNGPYENMGVGKKPLYLLGIGNQQQIRNFIEIVSPCIKNRVI